MAVYGPVRHQKNIIWTSEASVGSYNFFLWRTGPYTAIWPSVPWTICYIVNQCLWEKNFSRKSMLVNGCVTPSKLYFSHGDKYISMSVLYLTNTLSLICTNTQSSNGQVATLVHIISIPNQPACVFTSKCCMLKGEAGNTIC